MNTFRADLHLHTTLSPCGDLFMSPAAIVAKACEQGMDIIGVTDHNSTRHGALLKALGEANGLFVLCGAEVTSKEEVHCLVFLPDFETLTLFQEYLDAHLPDIKNDPNQFGYQVQVDEAENICYEEERLLISAINQSIDEIERKVHQLGGLFIPAHINRAMFSIGSQLGFVPPDLKYDALELSRHITRSEYLLQHAYLQNATFIQSSDAHFVDDVGTVFSEFVMEHRSFDEIRMAIKKIDGRFIKQGK